MSNEHEVTVRQSRLANGLIAVASLLVCLIVAEFASRLILPISPGTRWLDAQNNAVSIYQDDDFRLTPDTRVRMLSSEFDVTVTIGPLGHRLPAAEDPAMIFLGDSFTFGTGLNDEETFASIYCSGSDTRCVNLGRGNTGTFQQLNILEGFLEAYDWNVKELKLFMTVMSSSFMSGNDFLDNLREERAANSGSETLAGVDDQPLIKSIQRGLLAHSNLSRTVYYYFATQLRHLLSPEASEESRAAGFAVTSRQLMRLDEIARTHGFAYKIYVVHPIQDILAGTVQETLEVIRELAATEKVYSTADLFADDPRSYYYSYDGHLNPAGSRKIAEMLLQEESLGISH